MMRVNNQPSALNTCSEGTLVPHMQKYFLTNCEMRGNLHKFSFHHPNGSHIDSSKDKSTYIVIFLFTISAGESLVEDAFSGIPKLQLIPSFFLVVVPPHTHPLEHQGQWKYM